ncbi:MAG TPA: hypothetical protein VGP30_07510, partial [Candidatus Limnocylindrales bacterium]|nr:hypothetical protein [Candidatus Limnocylindrales bacterium]
MDLTLPARRYLLSGFAVLVVSLPTVACSQDAPQLPFATPAPTPERPRDADVIVVARGSGEV